MRVSRHFGSLEGAAECLDSTVRHNDDVVRIDLNIADWMRMDTAVAETIDAMLDHIDDLAREGTRMLAELLDHDKSTVTDYLRFHRDEVEGSADLDRAVFISRLRLARVGFYPDGAYGANGFVVLDFKLRGPPTDQLLVVRLTKDRGLVEVAWES